MADVQRQAKADFGRKLLLKYQQNKGRADSSGTKSTRSKLAAVPHSCPAVETSNVPVPVKSDTSTQHRLSESANAECLPENVANGEAAVSFQPCVITGNDSSTLRVTCTNEANTGATKPTLTEVCLPTLELSTFIASASDSVLPDRPSDCAADPIAYLRHEPDCTSAPPDAMADAATVNGELFGANADPNDATPRASRANSPANLPAIQSDVPVAVSVSVSVPVAASNVLHGSNVCNLPFTSCSARCAASDVAPHGEDDADLFYSLRSLVETYRDALARERQCSEALRSRLRERDVHPDTSRAGAPCGCRVELQRCAAQVDAFSEHVVALGSRVAATSRALSDARHTNNALRSRVRELESILDEQNTKLCHTAVYSQRCSPFADTQVGADDPLVRCCSTNHQNTQCDLLHKTQHVQTDALLTHSAFRQRESRDASIGCNMMVKHRKCSTNDLPTPRKSPRISCTQTEPSVDVALQVRRPNEPVDTCDASVLCNLSHRSRKCTTDDLSSFVRRNIDCFDSQSQTDATQRHCETQVNADRVIKTPRTVAAQCNFLSRNRLCSTDDLLYFARQVASLADAASQSTSTVLDSHTQTHTTATPPPLHCLHAATCTDDPVAEPVRVAHAQTDTTMLCTTADSETNTELLCLILTQAETITQSDHCTDTADLSAGLLPQIDNDDDTDTVTDTICMPASASTNFSNPDVVLDKAVQTLATVDDSLLRVASDLLRRLDEQKPSDALVERLELRIKMLEHQLEQLAAGNIVLQDRIALYEHCSNMFVTSPHKASSLSTAPRSVRPVNLLERSNAPGTADPPLTLPIERCSARLAESESITLGHVDSVHCDALSGPAHIRRDLGNMGFESGQCNPTFGRHYTHVHSLDLDPSVQTNELDQRIARPTRLNRTELDTPSPSAEPIDSPQSPYTVDIRAEDQSTGFSTLLHSVNQLQREVHDAQTIVSEEKVRFKRSLDRFAVYTRPEVARTPSRLSDEDSQVARPRARTTNGNELYWDSSYDMGTSPANAPVLGSNALADLATANYQRTLSTSSTSLHSYATSPSASRVPPARPPSEQPVLANTTFSMQVVEMLISSMHQLQRENARVCEEKSRVEHQLRTQLLLTENAALRSHLRSIDSHQHDLQEDGDDAESEQFAAQSTTLTVSDLGSTFQSSHLQHGLAARANSLPHLRTFRERSFSTGMIQVEPSREHACDAPWCDTDANASTDVNLLELPNEHGAPTAASSATRYFSVASSFGETATAERCHDTALSCTPHDQAQHSSTGLHSSPQAEVQACTGTDFAPSQSDEAPRARKKKKDR